MFHGIRLGRIAGVRLNLDWSLVLIFLLVVLSLGMGVFPSWHPDWRPTLTWALAVIAAGLFFVSVLLHELAHALVSHAFGLPVRSVTLFLFGGLAHVEDEPKSPKEDALIAAAGPATSIALGLAFVFVGGVLVAASGVPVGDPMDTIMAMGPVTTLLLWLGPVNIFLGLFNLLPAFPLDGGRILRALFWVGTKSLKRATRWAAGLGQTFALLMILAGVATSFGARLPVVGGGLVQGLWFIFIGWFLNAVAASSYRAVAIRDLLEDVTVGKLMRRRLPPTVPGTVPVSTLVDDYVLAGGESLFLVGPSSLEVTGLVRAEDVKAVGRAQWSTTPVSQIALPLSAAPQASPGDEAFKALQTLWRGALDVLVVVGNGQVLGLLTREDVARWLELESADEPRLAGARRAPQTVETEGSRPIGAH